MDYSEIEKELNKSPASISLHDQNVCNLRFYERNLYIRFVQSCWNDDIGILNDDNKIALLDLVLYDISIIDMHLGDIFNFVGAEVIRNEYKNGIFYLSLEDSDNLESFRINLKFKSFKWNVFKVVEIIEYYKYLDDVKELKLKKIPLKDGGIYEQKPYLGLFDEIEKDLFVTWENENKKK